MRISRIIAVLFWSISWECDASNFIEKGKDMMETIKDDYMFMIEQAIKAPSGHNTQPWIFEVGEDGITLKPDMSKSLPVVDADNREMFVSLGCALENLVIAASTKGYCSDIKVTDSGCVQVSFSLEEKKYRYASLFPQIILRSTNRSVYSGKSVEDSLVVRLINSSQEGNVGIFSYARGSKEYGNMETLIFQGNEIQMGDDAFKEELKEWMRYNKRHAERERDGLSYAVFGAPNLPIFISKTIMNGLLRPTAQNKSDLKKMKSSSHAVLFTVNHNVPEEWISLGRCLQRLLLQLTEHGISYAFMNQPCEIEDISRKLCRNLGLGTRFPVVLLRVGYAAPMPFSLRKEVGRFIRHK